MDHGAELRVFIRTAEFGFFIIFLLDDMSLVGTNKFVLLFWMSVNTHFTPQGMTIMN